MLFCPVKSLKFTKLKKLRNVIAGYELETYITT